MTNIKLSILLIVMILHSMTSCKQNDAVIYKNESIEFSFRKAQEQKQKMCLVLIDEKDTISRIYMKRLEVTYQDMLEDAVFNVIDLTSSENRWYKEWINSSDYPITCVFSEEKRLISIIGGASTYSFNNIEAALEKEPSGSNFGYKSFLSNLDINVLSAFLGNVLECKLRVDKGESCDVGISETLNVLRYPFNTYLKYKNEISQGKIDEATNTAHQLLEFQEDVQYVREYSGIFKEVMQFINPIYSPENDPILIISSKNIVLRNCTLNNPVAFQITIKNTGHSVLQIRKIDVGCGCIASLNKDVVTINPNEEDILNFTFIPDSEGKVIKVITFVSNATNSFEQVEVSAFVG